MFVILWNLSNICNIKTIYYIFNLLYDKRVLVYYLAIKRTNKQNFNLPTYGFLGYNKLCI